MGPPRGRGGRGNANWSYAAQPKAAPIPIPDADYQEQLKLRQYDDAEKERREEERRREAEERRRQREAGQKVDLGESGKYWETLAETGRAPPAVRGGRGGRGGQGGRGGRDFDTSSSWVPTTSRTPASSSASSVPPQGQAGFGSPAAPARSSGTPQDPWFAGSDPWASSASTSAQPYRPGHPKVDTRTSNTEHGGDWKQQDRYQGWQEAPKASTPQPEPHQGRCDEDSYGGERKAWTRSARELGAVRELTAEEKAHRALELQREAELRRAEKEAKSHDAMVTRAPAEPEEVGNWLYANANLDDDGLSRLLKTVMTPKYSRHVTISHRVGCIDLTHNRVSDRGVVELVDFLQQSQICTSELRLQGNRIKEPLALIGLLKHGTVGLKAGAVRELHLSVEDLSCEFLWRMMEACFCCKPRPPLRLCLVDGMLGSLTEVLSAAIGKGLRVAGPIPYAEARRSQLDVDLVLANVVASQ